MTRSPRLTSFAAAGAAGAAAALIAGGLLLVASESFTEICPLVYPAPLACQPATRNTVATVGFAFAGVQLLAALGIFVLGRVANSPKLLTNTLTTAVVSSAVIALGCWIALVTSQRL
jgi:hypothetical protein